MYRPSNKQPKKSGNWIQIDYDIRDYSDHTAVTHSLSLKPTDFDYNSINDWRWDGNWKEQKETDEKNIFVTCRKGSTSDITFSEDFPSAFKRETEKEIERILHPFN